ncbi:MAG: 2-oxo acid dehydrogenase subunit E2 [Deltaproteobacteria bacterium]|nr:2-oxo acid dehydrogenase subunit E2 [Deltaproteobacteria bacterium]
MSLFKRYEGEPVESESVEQRILPFLLKGRNDSVVYYEQMVDAGVALAWLERTNAERAPNERFTFFHVALGAIARAMSLRPKMNRFVIDGQIYQRKWLDISFMVKKERRDDAATSAVKVRFSSEDTLEDMARKARAAIQRGRSKEHTSSEREMALGLRLPRLALKAVVAGVRLLDSLNLMPRKMIEADELYATMFLAFLDGLNLEAPFHHLYEWGTISIFGSVGQVERRALVNARGEVEVRQVFPVRWTFDERVTDGFYAGRTMELFQKIMLDPQVLEQRSAFPASFQPSGSATEGRHGANGQEPEPVSSPPPKSVGIAGSEVG